MKSASRLITALACAALVGAFALAPAAAQTVSTYAATADGTGLHLSIGDQLALDIGISHAELDSTPSVSGLGIGIVQIDGTTAETSGNEGPETAEITSQTVPVPGVAELAVQVARGTSDSNLSPLSSTNRGELVGAQLELTPGGLALAGTDPFAVASTADVSVDGDDVMAAASSDEVVIPVNVGVDLIEQLELCELLGTIDPALQEACEAAIEGATEFAEVATIRILPSEVQCTVDSVTLESAVPVAQAAVLQVEVFGEDVVTVSPGQTVDLLEGTPAEIHAVVSDVATDTGEGSASATAAGLHLDIFSGDPIPTVSLVASEASCAVGAQAQTISQPGETEEPLPRTGAPLALLYVGGGALVVGGLGLRRFLKRA